MRGLAIAVVCLMGCSLDVFGQGSAGDPMTTSGESSSSGAPPTTTGGTATTAAATSSGGTTAADGTSTSTSTDGSSGTTGHMLACGEMLPDPGGCPEECSQCNAGLCLIDCGGGSGDCTQDIIVCPEDRSCQVQCSGTDSCRGAEVVCPPDHQCIVRCFGAACGSLQVTCGAGPCSLACNTSATACESARLQCGSNEGTITCNTAQDTVPEAVPPESGSECDCSVAESC